MISALTGELKRVDDDRIHLLAGPILYELLVPAADLTELQASLGEQLTLHTIFYLGGDPTRGGLEPTLIGFLRPDDRRFFNLFTTVKGIGPKTALKALTVPVGEIALAIENKDTRFLVGLSGIGKRTAELIVAELAGKVRSFATGPAVAGKGPLGPAAHHRAPLEEDAILALMAMGERRPDAEHLLDRAKQSKPDLKTTDALLREMLRMRTVRA
jgi:Holliday junction DNA helicase RuvA